MTEMDLTEFHTDGWLQEVNRQWFHPRGLALAVTVDTTRLDRFRSWLLRRPSTRLHAVWDERSDPEGWVFNYFDARVEGGPASFLERAKAPADEFARHEVARTLLLGDPIQALPTYVEEA